MGYSDCPQEVAISMSVEFWDKIAHSTISLQYFLNPTHLTFLGKYTIVMDCIDVNISDWTHS